MITAALGYFLTHFFLYVLALRHWEPLRKEKGIFLYHAIPAAALGVVCAGCIAIDPTQIPTAVLVLGLQGIYSLSFLEVWSLTQGGYSIRILDAVETARESGTVPDLNCCENFGTGKTTLRLGGLETLRMIRRGENGWQLTRLGRMSACSLLLLVRLVNHRNVG